MSDSPGDNCPICKADMRDGQYSRVIGVEEPAVYDGILYWTCPDFGGAWHRWKNGRLHDAARRFVFAVNHAIAMHRKGPTP